VRSFTVQLYARRTNARSRCGDRLVLSVVCLPDASQTALPSSQIDSLVIDTSPLISVTGLVFHLSSW
jgi:hypothetical protein